MDDDISDYAEAGEPAEEDNPAGPSVGELEKLVVETRKPGETDGLKTEKKELVERAKARLAGRGRKKSKEPVVEYKPPEPEGVKEAGFFWNYKGVRFFNKKRGDDGFTEQEVKEIGLLFPIPRDEIKTSQDGNRYVEVSDSHSSFYVRINEYGDVYLPEVRGSGEAFTDKKYGRVSDLGKIKGYVPVSPKTPKKSPERHRRKA